ncbi:MAG: hypothetical protein WBB18_12575, partial [Nodosilinea sp.]
MPKLKDRGDEQGLPRASLVLLEQFLHRYSQQHQISLLTEADLPAKAGDDSFWYLRGPELVVIITTYPHPA